MRSIVSPFDRIVSALSYITAGWGGLIFLVIMHFAGKTPSKFLRFNIFQSIFISFAVVVITMIYNLIFRLFTAIPIVQIVASWIDLMLNKPTFGEYSLVQGLIILYLCYMVMFCLLGRYPLIYKLSELFLRV